MAVKYPTLDLVNINLYVHTKFSQILTSIKDRNSATNLRKMTVNNPYIDLVNINVYPNYKIWSKSVSNF